MEAVALTVTIKTCHDCRRQFVCRGGLKKCVALNLSCRCHECKFKDLKKTENIGNLTLESWTVTFACYQGMRDPFNIKEDGVRDKWRQMI